MSRAAVCLFFIAILHTGIIQFSQANDTSTDGISKKDEEITTKPTEVKPVKDSEVPSKAEADEKSGVSEKKDDKTEEKEAKESKQEDVTETTDRMFISSILKEDPVKQARVLFELNKNILGPVNVVGTRIGEAISKGFDTAKDLAGGTFNLLRSPFVI